MSTLQVTPVVVQSVDGKVFQFPGETAAKIFEASARDAGGGTLRLVPATPPLARTLYDLEHDLCAAVETDEMVPADQKEEFALQLQAAYLATVEKRDRVGQFVLHVRNQIAFAKAERRRIEQREAVLQRALRRIEGGITRVIESLGRDGNGKRKKLDGTVCTLSLHGCDQRVELTDEEAVPARYKRATVTLPAETWALICDSLDFELRAKVLGEVKSQELEVSISLAKEDLKSGIEVPGAKLAGGTYVVCK